MINRDINAMYLVSVIDIYNTSFIAIPTLLLKVELHESTSIKREQRQISQSEFLLRGVHGFKYVRQISNGLIIIENQTKYVGAN